MYESEHPITSRHYLILTVIAFAAGIFVSSTFSANILFATVILMAAVFVVLSTALIIRLIRKVRPIKKFLLPLFLIFCMLAGIFRVASFEMLFPGALKEHTNNQVWLTGTVVSHPTVTSKGRSAYFEFEVIKIDDKYITPETMIIYTSTSQGNLLSRGDKINCWTSINEPGRSSEPDNYDYHPHLRGKDIFYIGNINNANRVNFQKPFHLISSIKDLGRFANTKICNAADGLFKKDSRSAAILKGIMVGDKSGFSGEMYQNFSNSGLSHIVSVSGMHLSILFSTVMSLLNSMNIRKRYSVILAIPLLLFFAATAEFTPSVCRAALMYLLLIMSNFFRQRYSSLTALFFSLGIILLFSPYALYSKSLTLSFGAALGIQIYYKYGMGLIKSVIPFQHEKKNFIKIYTHRALTKILGSFMTTFAVCIGTVYFSALFFGKLSWVQFLTNLWVVPIVSVVFILGYLACILSWIIPPLVTVLSYPLGWCLKIISFTAEVFGKADYTITITKNISFNSFFIIYLGFALIIYMTLKTHYDLYMRKTLRKLKSYLQFP